MWYVVHTMAGLEQKCMQQCQQYVDQADYSEMFIPLYMAKNTLEKNGMMLNSHYSPVIFSLIQKIFSQYSLD